VLQATYHRTDAVNRRAQFVLVRPPVRSSGCAALTLIAGLLSCSVPSAKGTAGQPSRASGGASDPIPSESKGVVTAQSAPIGPHKGARGGGSESAPILPDSPCRGDGPWAPSTRFTVTSPKQFGAVGNGVADDTAALAGAVNALPARGGIVRFEPGSYRKANHIWTLSKDHVLLWSPSGDATIHGAVRVRTAKERLDGSYCGPREQATIFQRTRGGGVHGLRFTSDATERLSCAETSQLVLDGVQEFEVVGVEIAGSSSVGIFAWRSDIHGLPARNLRIVGNYVHHTHADAIHHTAGTRESWVWDNDIFNEEPTRGDDGVACVTYGVASPRCGAMEWWGNRYLGGTHGRGLAIVGGEDILVHHNWIVGSAGAGLIVASENGYSTASSNRIQLTNNWLVGSPNGSANNGHPSILISGSYLPAEPLSDIIASSNVIVAPAGGRTERAEGRHSRVSFDNKVGAENLPGPPPQVASAGRRETSVLRTWDVSFVREADRRGLYRIHVREGTDAQLEERFEYIVRGPTANVAAWIAGLRKYSCDVRLVSQQGVGRDAVALVLTSRPATLPSNLRPVTFHELRAGDRDGTLSELWKSVDANLRRN
jgi:hypothetical protein